MQPQTLVIPVPTGKAEDLGRFVTEVSDLCIKFGIDDMNFVLAPVEDVLAKLGDQT
jgi:hypothetical protein